VPGLGLASILPSSICSSAQWFTSALGASCRSAVLVHARVIYSAASLSLLGNSLSVFPARVNVLPCQSCARPAASASGCLLCSGCLSLLKSFNFCVDFYVNHCREKSV
jgi:hypothetical protein